MLISLLIVPIFLFFRYWRCPDKNKEYRDSRDNCFSYSGRTEIYDKLGTRASDKNIKKYLDLKDDALKTVDRVFGPSLWDYRGFNICLVIAVVYPLLLVILQWVFTGNGEIGDVDIIPRNPVVWKRVVLPLVLILEYVIIHLAFSGKLQTWLQKRFSFSRKHNMIAGAVAVAGAVAFAVAFAGAFAGAFAVAVAFAFVFAGSGDVDVDGAFAFAFAFAGVVAFAVVVAFAFAFAFAVAGAFAVVVAFAFAFAVAFAVAFAFGLVIIAAFSSTKNNLSQWVIGLVCLSLTIGGVLVALFFVPVPPEGFILIIVVGIYPVINAVFDFFSLQFTRVLLRKLKPKNPWPKVVLIGLLDIAGALVILLLLIFCTREAFVFVDNVYYPDDTVFAYSDWKHWYGPLYWPNTPWLWGMTLTTVLMSFFHLIIVLMSLFFLNKKKAKDLQKQLASAREHDPKPGTPEYHHVYSGDRNNILYKKISGYLVISPLLTGLAIAIFVLLLVALARDPSVLAQLWNRVKLLISEGGFYKFLKFPR